MAYKQKYEKKEVKRKTFTPLTNYSKRQKSILEAVKIMCLNSSPSMPPILPSNLVLDDKGNVVVMACAGSGKTSTIMYVLSKIASPRLRILLTSFANSIVNELQAYTWQFPGVDAQGLHSVGYGVLKSAFKFVNMNKNKMELILKEFDIDPWEKEGEERADDFKKQKALKSLVHFIKVTLTDWKDIEAVNRMIVQYNIDMEGYYEELLSLLPLIMEKSIKQVNVIDFDDMLFMPIHLNLRFPKYDIVFGDECQDYNKAQIEMINRMTDHAVLVGDRFQAIYGFSGADTQSVSNILEKFNAVELPLDVNYRCGEKIVKEAQKVLDSWFMLRQVDKRGEDVITPWEGAVEGNVEYLKHEEYLDKVQPGDFIACRKNAPLVGPCFALLKKGIRSKLRGKDISEQIIKLFNQVCKKSKDIDEAIKDIYSYKDKEEIKLIKRYRENSASAIETLENKVDTLLEFVSRAEKIQQVPSVIESIFSDEEHEGEVGLGTCHFSKGLEFERVFIIEHDDFMTMRDGSNTSDVDQRYNLKYIAYTRAKKELFLVNKPVEK